MPEVIVKNVKACKVASVEARGFEAMKAGFGELGEWMKATRVRPGSPPGIVVYENSPEEVGWDNCVTLVCVPVLGEPKPSGRVKIGELPAITAATLVHQGPYDQLPGAWARLYAWIFANGYRPVAVGREAYLNDCDVNPPEAWLTEVQVPVTRRSG